jgi:hypothetical protein
MKLQLVMAAGILMLISSCGPRPMGYRSYRNNNTSPVIGIIIVECRNEQQTRQSVIQTLKMARVSDWKNDQRVAFETIEARYEDLTEYKAAQIEQLLKQMPGVTDVEVKWENGLIQSAPQRAAIPYMPRL